MNKNDLLAGQIFDELTAVLGTLYSDYLQRNLTEGDVNDAVILATDDPNSPEDRATRLIAAAPEMCEALEWTARGEHHSACKAPRGHPKKCSCYVGAAQAALVKVREIGT